ncbi:MAG: DUF1189 family protein [Clostridia bacterium]|nr:DUF1189 family protein [Clostridia bacterium]
MEETKKIGLLKRLKMSLFELENYIDFTAEKASKAIWFAIKMVIVFGLIIAISSVLYIYLKYQSPSNYVQKIVPEFSYNDHNLIIDEEEKNDEDKKFIANMMQQLEPVYREFLPGGMNSKSNMVDFVKSNEQQLVIFVFLTLFLETILEMFVFWLMIAFLTSLIGLIVLKFSRIKMKFSKLYAMSIYASTLSMILTIIYTILNNYFNVYIDIFEYLSMLIAYIYITAVIYMIKSDLIKQQLELIKIATVQAKVKEQMEREKEEKNKEEKKEKDNDEKEDELEGNIVNDNEPDGSEI